MIGGDLFDVSAVERPAPDKAPTAFRLWRAGVNQSDIGPVNLTAAALSKLLAMQEQHGTRYSFDLAHGTLNPQSPKDLQVAYGDHQLEGRAGELWAVDCQWSDWARAQIEQKPVPGLRYYSPAYDVDKATREPTRYVNCALTPNPATWNATALAAAKGTSMDPKEEEKPPGAGASGGPSVDPSAVVAMLHKLMTETTDEEQRTMYRKALAALMPKDGEEKPGEGEPPPSSEGGPAAAKAAAKAASPAPAAAAAVLPPEMASMLGGLVKSVASITTRLDVKDEAERTQRAAADATERTQLAALKGLAPPVAAAIKDPTTPIATARALASVVPGGLSLASITTSSVAGTRGSPERAIAQLPEEQASAMARQMGLRPAVAEKPHVNDMGQLVLPCETPTQARARLAQKAAVS